MAERFAENPLIQPADVTPSREDFEVVGTFNAGAVRLQDRTLLLIRVAERPRDVQPGWFVAPWFDPEDPEAGIKLLRVRQDDPDFEPIDARWFHYRGDVYLTSISHLRIARSADGRRFVVDPAPAMRPCVWYESYGVEDPRITPLDGRYYITYTGVSKHGIATGLAVTQDFLTFERIGMIFSPENRDVTIFPARIRGRYAAYHRPVPKNLGGPDMWLAYSPDLQYWGDHRSVIRRRPGSWDGQRIGGGAVPILTDRGWLEIYHGADANNRYCLGAILTDAEHPDRILGRSVEPILAPEQEHEIHGFFGNVVFTCGAVLEDDGAVTVYYGAADAVVCAARFSLEEIFASLGEDA